MFCDAAAFCNFSLFRDYCLMRLYLFINDFANSFPKVICSVNIQFILMNSPPALGPEKWNLLLVLHPLDFNHRPFHN